MKRWLWMSWLILSMTLAAYLTRRYLGPDRTVFLPGTTTHGHYQIELACNACHTPWMGVKEDACYRCHGADLAAAKDTHPKSKFTDPRNADRLTQIDAANCVACHREHLPGITRDMGVTMPMDYCAHCHVQTLTDRPSHRNLPFNSCATAGCHNYHDNTALYTEFLLKHAGEPWLKSDPKIPVRILTAALSATARGDQPGASTSTLSAGDADAPDAAMTDEGVLRDWALSSHARAGVNCSGCHGTSTGEEGGATWTDTPGHAACAECHQEQTRGFLGGRHGMRLAEGLSPMRPGMARLPMKPDAAHRELGCASCHDAHASETRTAAVEACLSCHNDAHSLAYKDSPHFSLWRAELSGEAPPGSGVSCATCHLPREIHLRNGVEVVRVHHNQNDNLRPNEKMIRTVCQSCHGLSFALDALADRDLIRANFSGKPASHVDSIDMALRFRAETEAKKRNNQNQ